MIRIVLGFILIFLWSCSGIKQTSLPPKITEIQRPDRGYIHWLEKQAMYNQARALLAEVSQSERMWLNTANAERSEILLQAAPNWLNVDILTFKKPFFQNIASQLSYLPEPGIKGLYLGETNETGELWQKPGSNHKMASLEFAPDTGDEESFNKLAQMAENEGIELGSDLLGASTGISPDFILQTRNAPGSQGIYAMLEVPQNLWSKLPAISDENIHKTINEKTFADLSASSIIPASLARDAYQWASRSGWAATGEIAGIDGKIRRWLYRYSQTADSPVFMWHDPFGQAKRILSAAIIRQTGLQGQTLTGLHIEPLFGLDPVTAMKTGKKDFAPGLDALNDLASQIHRYGGWAMQADAIPAFLVPVILAGATDFCRDDMTALTAIYGLITADAAPFANLYAAWKKENLDFRRLARGLDKKGLFSIHIAQSANFDNKNIFKNKNQSEYMSLSEILADSKIPVQTAKDFLLNIKTGLPGLAFYTNDETGILYSDRHKNERPIMENNISSLLAERQKRNLALGKLSGIFKNGNSGIGLLTELPNGDFWLLAINFSKSENEIAGLLPAKAKLAFSSNKSSTKLILNGRKFQLALDGYQCLNVVFSLE